MMASFMLEQGLAAQHEHLSLGFMRCFSSGDTSEEDGSFRGNMSRLIKHLHEPAESCTDSQTGWDDDFDDDDDENGYESPYSGYESPYSGEEGGGGDEESTDKDYEPPPKEPHDLSHHLSLKLPTRDNGVYFGSRSNDPPPPIVCPRPPVSPRMKRDPGETPTPPSWREAVRKFSPRAPLRSFREKKPGRKPASTLPTHRGVPPGSGSMGLDPCWYVGEVTRGQAESCLQRLNKDGAYLVRDSTRQRANQPFTLVVFYQGKVFNIQIRQENQQFLLGTGFKVHESFPSVNSIIHHYSQSPLLLIDAKKRRSRQQNQCLLSDPAGFYMARQNWS